MNVLILITTIVINELLEMFDNRSTVTLKFLVTIHTTLNKRVHMS